MKNEDLFVYKKSDFYEDFISSQKEYYEREQVDTLLAEKDREIALLKEHIANGDVSRITWIDEVIELKQKLDEKESWVKMLGEGVAAMSLELEKTKQKLEDVQASMYCDVVDANMEVRRLKRALWIARAERAEARKNYWCARSCHEGDDFLVSIDGSPVKYIGCIKRTNYDWLLTWSEVESKCRAKAEASK